MSEDCAQSVIQWFPGHMAKTRRQIAEDLSLCDLVAELLDARIPLSSANPEIDGMVGKKPRIRVLNKADIADEAVTAGFLQYFKSLGQNACAFDAKTGRGRQDLLNKIKLTLTDYTKKLAEKGMAGKPLRVMVVGIPNVGKSSFINRLVGRGCAKTADRPGVTRGRQWFSVDKGLELLDTPGVLWPKFEDKSAALRLAFCGAVKDEITDTEEIAFLLYRFLFENYKDRLALRYKFDPDEYGEADGFYEIGKRRGFFQRGGEIDTLRLSVMLLDEFRGGLLGRISLEKAG